MGSPESARRPAVRILRLAAGGDGVGRLADGCTVFVPRTAPGDLVRLGAVQRRRNFARATAIAVEEAGPGRVEPRCPHFAADRCGGCQWQHLSAHVQRAARQRIVGDALRRVGRLAVDDPPIVAGGSEWEYRERLGLHAESGRIGLHRLDDPVGAFDLVRCHIASPPIQALWDVVREHRALLPSGLSELSLRRDASGGLHLLAGLRAAGRWPSASRLVDAAAARDLSVRPWVGAPGLPMAPADDASLGGFPATVFEQVNPAMGERIRSDAVAALGVAGRAVVWDLYAGTGQTTSLLAAEGAQVSSVEADARAVEWADRHGPPAQRVAMKVEDAAGVLPAPALVIANPPRGGMHERAVAMVAAARPRRFVYISCDPATLARDLARLGPGYRVDRVTAYDLFPQTAHVETVAVMECQ